jgi:anti-anti-sigma regulatory factor
MGGVLSPSPDALDRGSVARPGPTVVALGPSLTLPGIVGLKHRLEAVLASGAAVHLDGGAVTSIDTAGIQLLLAFCLEARTSDVEVTWQAASETVKRSAARLGLASSLGLAAPAA